MHRHSFVPSHWDEAVRYFHKIVEGINVLPVMHPIMRNPAWWEQDDIVLRNGASGEFTAQDAPLLKQIPSAKAFGLDLMKLVSGSQLGRMVISRVEYGKKFVPTKEANGKYREFYSRYHLILQGLPGNLFTCGNETVAMLTGEVYWFDMLSDYFLLNNSADDRIHLQIDVRIDP